LRKAITSRYIDQIATKTIALADANQKILQTGRDYYANLEKQKSAYQGVTGVAIGYQLAINNAKDANKEARQSAEVLKNEIIGLNTQLLNTIALDTKNPFNQLDKGAKELAKSTKEIADNVQKIGGQGRPITPDMTAPVLLPRAGVPSITNGTQNAPLNGRTSGFDAITATRDVNEQAKAQALYNIQLQQTKDITNLLAPAFDSVIQAMVMGEDIGLALQAAFKQIVIQLIQMVAQALLFKAIMAAITGGTSEIGTAVGGGLGMGGGNLLGQFLLKGSDLVLATQRANNNLNIRRGN
jgi:hypothetical protein